MRYITVFTAATALLASPGLAKKDWQTNFYQGIECTGEALGVHHGDVTPKKGATCHQIPHIGVTSAMDFYDKLHGNDEMFLSLHKDHDCKDSGGGKYEGQPVKPVCIDVGNAVAFKIHAISAAKRDEQSADAESELPDADAELQGAELWERSALDEDGSDDELIDGDDESSIEARRSSCFTATFLLGSVSGAGLFWHNAFGTCPLTANEGNVNNAQCGLNSVLGVSFTLLSGFSAQGLYRFSESKREELLPYQDTSLIDGLSITMTPAGDLPGLYYESTADGWEHYNFHAQDLDDLSQNHTTVLSIHQESGRNRITAPVGTQEALDRRSKHYVAYYAWSRGKTDLFKKQKICKTKDAAKHLAIRLYNYAHSHNKNSFCANLFGKSAKLSDGEFAFIDGTFYDQAASC